ELAGNDDELTNHLDSLVAAEAAWRQNVGRPLATGQDSPAAAQQRLTAEVTGAGSELTDATRAAREDARQQAREDTRNTAILVGLGLAGALLAALILFSGLINSMRGP